ncbi:MAG: glycosyltransferase family 1 protein [Cyanobacteria bacterium J06600_6]
MHVFIAALHRPIKPTGVCRHAANLARCLAEKPEVTKISLVIGSWQENYFQTVFALEFDKIDLIVVKIKNSSIVRNLWFLRGLPKLANQLNADVVHLSFPFPFLRSKFKVPVVTTVHDLYPYECPENFGFPRVLFNQLFLKQAIANSDGLPCVSQITLDKLKLYFPQLKPQQQLEVVYNYVDFDGLETNPPKELPIDQKFLLTVAQHRQNKNLDLLIQAYAKLRQEQQIEPDCNLVIVGTTGPETEKIKGLIVDLDLQERVKLLSALDDSQLGWLYQNCRAFVIPSSTEGFCLPLAEALHYSDRVVCSDIPIFREIATEQCTYFSLSDNPVDSLSQALIQVMQHPSVSGRQNIKRFDRSHIAQQYLDLYGRIKQSDSYAFMPSA